MKKDKDRTNKMRVNINKIKGKVYLNTEILTWATQHFFQVI